MCSPGINGEGELRGQPANPGSPGKMAVKTECVCVTAYLWRERVTRTEVVRQVSDTNHPYVVVDVCAFCELFPYVNR